MGSTLLSPGVLTNLKPRLRAEQQGACADTGGARDARGDHREIEHVLHVGSVLRAAQTRGPEVGMHFLRSVGGMEIGNVDAARMTKL